jgi:hypothetical protein
MAPFKSTSGGKAKAGRQDRQPAVPIKREG